MKKQELTPTLQEWSDYMNKQYDWCFCIGASPGDEITPRLIELILRAHKLIVEKEQDQ